MNRDIFRGTTPNMSTAEGSELLTDVTLPQTDNVVNHGTYYYKFRNRNEHGVSEPSTVAIQAVSVAPASPITYTNGIGVVTLTSPTILGADSHHLEASDDGTTWEEIYVHTGANPTYSISNVANLRPYYRHYGTYGDDFTGDVSAVFSYTTPVISDIILAIEETATQLTFTYAGGSGASQVSLRTSSGASVNQVFTTSSITINRPTVDTVFYAQAVAGFTTKNSNSLSYNSKLPITGLAASFINTNAIRVTWNAPANSAYTGTRIGITTPSGQTTYTTIAKGTLTYDAGGLVQAGTYTVSAEAVYSGGNSTAVTTTVAVALAPVTRLTSSYVVASNTITLSWVPPVNTAYTGIRIVHTNPQGTQAQYNLGKVSSWTMQPGLNGTHSYAVYGLYNSNLSAAASTSVAVTMPVGVTNFNAVFNSTSKQVNVTWTVPTNSAYTGCRVAYKLNTATSWTYQDIAKGTAAFNFSPAVSGTYQVNVAALYGTTEIWSTERSVGVVLQGIEDLNQNWLFTADLMSTNDIVYRSGSGTATYLRSSDIGRSWQQYTIPTAIPDTVTQNCVEWNEMEGECIRYEDVYTPNPFVARQQSFVPIPNNANKIIVPANNAQVGWTTDNGITWNSTRTSVGFYGVGSSVDYNRVVAADRNNFRTGRIDFWYFNEANNTMTTLGSYVHNVQSDTYCYSISKSPAGFPIYAMIDSSFGYYVQGIIASFDGGSTWENINVTTSITANSFTPHYYVMSVHDRVYVLGYYGSSGTKGLYYFNKATPRVLTAVSTPVVPSVIGVIGDYLAMGSSANYNNVLYLFNGSTWSTMTIPPMGHGQPRIYYGSAPTTRGAVTAFQSNAGNPQGPQGAIVTV